MQKGKAYKFKHCVRQQVMLCMECAEKFVDVANDFVGKDVHDDIA